MSTDNAIEVAILGSGRMGQHVLHHLTASPLVHGITAYDPVPEKVEELRTNLSCKGSSRT